MFASVGQVEGEPLHVAMDREWFGPHRKHVYLLGLVSVAMA